MSKLPKDIWYKVKRSKCGKVHSCDSITEWLELRLESDLAHSPDSAACSQCDGVSG